MSVSGKPLGLVLVLAVVLGAGACMFEPANEQVVTSRRRPVRFSGAALAARAELILEASASPAGPFTQVGIALADGAPMVLGGATLYAFSAEVAIPPGLWAQTCAGFETFVRARGGSLVLTTYDSEAIAGVSPAQCVAEAVTGGAPFVFAATQCASPFGAPVRLRAPGGGLSGNAIERDVRIVNPHQAADYACIEVIDGALAIVDPTPSDIALPALTEVTGSLEVLYPRRNSATRAVDMPALTAVGGDVSLASPRPAEGEADVLIDFALPALSSIGGDLTIEFAGAGDGLDGVAGLPGVTSLPFDLEIVNLSGADTGYSNLLPSLGAVGGHAHLDVGLTCHQVLPALATVDGDLTLLIGTLVSGMESLSAVGGNLTFRSDGGVIGGELPALASVGGDLHVTADVVALGPGQRYLETLGMVGGVLHYTQSQAPIAQLGSLAVSVLGLELDANPSLMDLAASLAHISIASDGPVTITDNPAITDCEAQSYADGLPDHVGPVTISGNGPC